MASSLPGWQTDSDRPAVLAMGLEARNALLYGEFRDYPEWRDMVLPPMWRFAADNAINIQLQELWTLIAETHFIHVLFKMLPPMESLRAQRDMQAQAAEETAGHVTQILGRLRAFAGRHAGLEIELGLFDINWAKWWPFEPAESPADVFEAGADAIVAEVSHELSDGSRFQIASDQVHDGMAVLTVGGEFPFETVIRVVSFDHDAQTVRCQDLATQEIKKIPLAHLRDFMAARVEVQRRIEELFLQQPQAGTPLSAGGRQIALELIEEVRSGTRFTVSADEVELGMRVCCVGSELDPMDIAEVIEWDPDTQTAACRGQSGITALVKLAGLRNAVAVIQEMMERTSALTGSSPPVPPPFTPN